jgi:membrane protein DedA with SNARE-associated domain
MNELVAALCIACIVGGWVVYVIGKKRRMTFKDLKK